MTTVVTKQVEGTTPEKSYKSRWWIEDEGTYHSSIFPIVENITKNQNYRHLNNIKYARLYQNMEVMGFYGSLYSRTANQNFNSNRLTLNVVKSAIDTAAAKISKNKPKPMFLTSGGNYKQQRKAKELNKYVEGLFYEMDIYKEAQKDFIDASVMGTGALKFFKQNDKIKCERVLIDEIVVDDSEGMYGTPETLYQVKFVSRDILHATFKTHTAKINAASSGISGDAYNTSSADLVRVVEAWHLGEEGKHVISISNADLFCEEWEKDYFPFAFFRWCPRIVGFYGTGIAEEILGIQLEINKTLRNIQRAIELNAVPRWMIENSSQINTAHLQNEISSIIKYSGTQPTPFVAPAMSQEVYAYLENLYRKAFEIVGISQLSAMAQKPAGLNAGVALREYNDIESERFILQGQRWESHFLDAAKICIDMSRDLYETNKDLSVNVKRNKFIEKIKWKDVDLDEDSYIMQAWPVSLLPSTPAGKLEKITELTQAGYIDQEQAKSLLDFPDLEQYMNVANSSVEDLNMMIDKMIDQGIYTSPEPYMNLEQCIQTTQSYYLFAKTQSVPEERLELLRQFIDDCQQLLQMAQPEPMMPPPAMDPMAAPMAPPESELLPIGPVV